MRRFLMIMAISYLDGDIRERSDITAGISMLFNFLAFALKLLAGLFTRSLVLMYSGIYAIGLGMAKYFYFKGMTGGNSRRDQHKYAMYMGIALLVSALFFNACMLLRHFLLPDVFRAPAFMSVAVSAFFVCEYIMSMHGVHRARRMNDPLFSALKLTSLSATLMLIVIMQRTILSSTGLSDDAIRTVNAACGYSVAVLLTGIAVIIVVKNARMLAMLPREDAKHLKSAAAD